MSSVNTDAWRNWQAFLEGEPVIEEFLDEFHSDLPFFGGPVKVGPYCISTVIRKYVSVGRALVLSGGIHAWLSPEVVIDGKLAPSDSTAYHGGTMSDEIAALIPLELGVRVRNAGAVWSSGIHWDKEEPPPDPLYFETPRLMRPGREGIELLPRVTRRPGNLDKLERLPLFPLISQSVQADLVRAAGSYSAAIWWANEDPNQAWLQLVTAVEIAAKQRQTATASPLDLLSQLWPEMLAALNGVDNAVRIEVAEQLTPLMKSTKAFVDFLEQCAPPPPSEPRPQFDQLDWSNMRKHAKTIYDHRSKALHTGKPFPMPMLDEPRTNPDGPIQEVPGGLNSGGLGGIWAAKEMPMLLSAFEYIARGALLTWWDELITASSPAAPSQPSGQAEPALDIDRGALGSRQSADQAVG